MAAELFRLGRRSLSAQRAFLVHAHQISRTILQSSPFCSVASSSPSGEDGEEVRRMEGSKWLTLPVFAPRKDASSVAKGLAGGNPLAKGEPTTALKWVRRCCPHLPISLVQKLFRLRQVRKAVSITTTSEEQPEQQQLKRVSAKEAMSSGEVILLPNTVQNFTTENNYIPKHHHYDIKLFLSLILYKDSAIIVINKPYGLPVQGGVGVKHCVDVLAATLMKFDFPEAPRLVHRLDRDSSGLLILGRTQVSSSILHSVFREKTCGALKMCVKNAPRILQRKYWALVIGSPKQSSGLISAPVGKVILEDGRSERITVIKDEKPTSSQHSLTEFKVMKISEHGYTWLELCPLTGRKHQLRVHCAEVLRTPIVGDYKYGYNAHRKWKPIVAENEASKLPKQKLPFGLDFEGGSISDEQPRLHLHCRQMILPDIAAAVNQFESSSHELEELDMLDLVAPLPSHMQLSWDTLSF
ncbi:RNA pseudouridine synthase 4, mitochondrial [Apostasia shenzhenica]|uniref:RNA pseudouridine synthase 4, mitochondrial n=1 Tax=Apostasia shenzhenica TaxID=1088818 RepID=A0A2I0AF02_9ASPA|nr:RNA pseudouridine synthase 4, mitochondrial [Apostasia shenzhenica]